MSPPRGGSRRRDELALEVLRARRLRSQRRKRVARRRRVGVLAGAACIVLVGVFLTVGLGGAIAYQQGCSLSSLEPFSLGENTFIYAADGSRLGAIPSEGRNRQKVSANEISPWVVKATVAVEDKRYWQHGGIDPIGITRAFWADVSQGKVVQGGSTITQQLVRNLYISRERTFTRKLREACLAVKLADKWSKEKILTAYLNQIYYGSQAYGVEAASQTYFSKPAKKLTLAQAALLAGLPQAPSRYDPFANPRAARVRRKQVLRAMLTTGAITRHQYRKVVRHHDLHLKPGVLYKKIRQPYFFSYVRDELVRQYGEARVRHGGLRVYTTIDPRLQRAARKAISDTLYLSNDPAAALVAIDPATGAIRAMTAVSPGRAKNQFNLIADAHRQAGSTFKTFVLATAIEQGLDPDSTYYLSAPLDCSSDPCYPDKPWHVEVYDKESYSGNESVTNATLQSDNTVYARLTMDVGADNVAAMATRLGVRTPFPKRSVVRHIPSIGLGSIAVTPLDMASAYATLAARGLYSKPMAITKVVLPKGTADTKAGWGKPQQKQVHFAGCRVRGDAHPPGERPLRDRYRRELRQARRRQDGDDRESRRRLVRRLHAATRGDRLDGLSAGRDPDDQRARHRGCGRDVPRGDLAPVHGEGARERADAQLPLAEHVPDVQGLARRVAVQRRLVHADAGLQHAGCRTTTTTATTQTRAGASSGDAREGEEEESRRRLPHRRLPRRR